MKSKIALIFSLLSILLPILSIIINLHIELEFSEAIAAGIVVGCASGTVTGITALILNGKKKNTLVTVLSIIPMIPTAIFLLLWVPYYAFG